MIKKYFNPFLIIEPLLVVATYLFVGTKLAIVFAIAIQVMNAVLYFMKRKYLSSKVFIIQTAIDSFLCAIAIIVCYLAIGYLS